MAELIQYAVREGVGILTLNRPDKLNAINDEMHEQLHHQFDRALDDPDSRAILIRAEGRAFCTGRDTTMLGHRAKQESDYHFVLRHQQRNLQTIDHPKPVVAAINGYAIGGGFELALAADIRVAADDAQMAIPEIRYGILPDTGASQFLSMLIGPSRTKLMMLTGRMVDAATADRWGMVDIVVPRDALDEEAFAVARDIASRPPIALAMGKQLANHLWNGRVREGIGMELLTQTALFWSEDYQEARAALREKRKPDYKGR
ncbi:enoyl-CoA hydratase/isomerase family protein [Sphingobium sp. Sx8-8]|uniref:enoyl-CoA hydratase/isomerase family protein n=1 Tax=Sphingobium sp. Sx8-8 TaxID=2933617 RepID=UPI001F5AD446|nr:enoyl-CoA hydratase/isomerase family protein [Sphingobium sp. Sx8-8]